MWAEEEDNYFEGSSRRDLSSQTLLEEDVAVKGPCFSGFAW